MMAGVPRRRPPQPPIATNVVDDHRVGEERERRDRDPRFVTPQFVR
jgi:hypothetical protein